MLSGRIICGGGGFLEFNDQDGSGSTCGSVANVLAAVIGEVFSDIAKLRMGTMVASSHTAIVLRGRIGGDYAFSD